LIMWRTPRRSSSVIVVVERACERLDYVRGGKII